MKNFISIKTTEDEQIEQIKDWIKNSWVYIAAGIAIGISSMTGWNYYQTHQSNQTKEARTIYLQISKNTNYVNSLSLYDELKTKYSGSFYILEAELLLAKYAALDNKFNDAISHLELLLVNNNKEIAKIAKLQLAEVYIMQKQYSKALETLDTQYNILDATIEDDYFQAIINNMKGDIYFLDKKFNLAKEQYNLIINDTNIKNQEFINLVKIKITNL